MKNSKLIILLSICLVLSVIGNLLLYFKPTILKEFAKKEIKVEPVFEISNVFMKISKNYEGGVTDGGIVRVDFEVTNISNSTQMLFSNNLSLFDFEKCSFLSNNNYHLKGDGDYFTQLSVAEKITPKTKLKMALVFEVPIGEFYSFGCTENIKIIGKQTFIDDIRNVVSKFNNFEGMLEARQKFINGEARKMGRAGHPNEDYGVEVCDSANE